MPASVQPLKGVFEDASSPVVAQQIPQTLHVAQGTDNDVRVTVVNLAGNAVDLTGASAKLTARVDPTETASLFQKSGVIAAPLTGVIDFAVAAADTALIAAGVYCYDVVITFADGKKAQVVPLSTLAIDANVSL